MANFQDVSKRINALLMCHLPLLFACIVLKYSLMQSDVTRLQLNMLTIVQIVALSPLILLFLIKFPINFSQQSWLLAFTPILVAALALLVHVNELTSLFRNDTSNFTFHTQAALVPLLILSEALPNLKSSLHNSMQKKERIEKVVLTFCALLVSIQILKYSNMTTPVLTTLLLFLSVAATIYGLALFYLSQYRPENAKLMSILLYFNLQSELIKFFIPTFDSQISSAILFLGVVFALTLDSVFLKPEALAANGFSMSLATRRLRDAYEKKITDSANLASATLDSLSAHICILNSSGVITAVNRSWQNFINLSGMGEPVASVGQNYLDLCHNENTTTPCFSAEIALGIENVLSRQIEEYTATYIFSSTNARRWYLCRVTRFETSEGCCAVVTHEDVTELKSTEEELLLKNAAIERANDGIVLTDPTQPDDPVVYASPGFLKLTGYTKEEVLGRNCRFLQGPDTDPKVIQKIRDAVKNERPFVCEVINYTKSGHAWMNRLKLEPIRDEQGKLLRYLGVQSNITEQRRLEEERNRALEKERLARLEAERHFQEAKNANSLKDEFLATLSHELRTPAGVIGGFVELLKYEKMSLAEQEEALDAIERNSRSLATLIDDLLDVSRVITGKFKLNPKPVDLANIVESVISAEILAAQAKNIRIVTEFEPGLGPIYGDTTRLQQIFWNLLSNAIKFTPRNGRVKVTLKMDGGRAIVKVADTGVGIEPKFLPHVFERFRQQDSGMNRTYGGLGLGLSIVKHLVELHGGDVWADSDGQGRGSTFTVSLPVLTSAG